MENAIWNGQIYIATEVAENYALEKDIRKASELKELRCPDLECLNPTLKYCHGEVKDAYFAHRNNCTCDYAQFDKENNLMMRRVKHKVYDIFTSRGFDVQQEVKLLPHHYTHLLFTLPNGQKIAVELGTQKTTAKTIDSLSKQYASMGITLKWIVICDTNTPVKENETFFIKRYLLNENKWKDVLILNHDGTEITQYITEKFYSDVFKETGSLADLVFEENELTIAGFHKNYNKWREKKKNDIDSRMSNPDEAVWQGGYRIRRCLHCDAIKTAVQFDPYIYYDFNQNLGCCTKCKKNNVPKKY